MKTARPTSPFLSVLSAFLLLGAVAFSGCTASELAGPDSAPETETVQNVDPRPSPFDGAHNTNGEGGGGTGTGAGHNEMPGE